MKLERVQPQLLRLDLHPMELAALVTAARWVVAGQQEAAPAEAVRQLRQILAGYERQTANLGLC